jgi:hypothetical protein
MKLKLDEAGKVVVKDGLPVYVHDDGKELAFDAAAATSTISRLNGEAQKHREDKQAIELKLKAFEGLDDPEAAKKAVELMKNIDDKKLVDAGKVEEVKRAAVTAAEEKHAAAAKTHALELKTVSDKYEALTSQYNTEKVGGAFKGSKFIADKVRIPPDMVDAKFGRHFKVEEGKLVGYDNSGNKMYSRSKPGELADFEEAIETLIESYPSKADILKGSGHSGSGAKDEGGDKKPGGGSGTVNMGGTREERVKALNAQFPELAKAE